jgi:TolB-like protein/DNA-binding winged helix-turn-helix (wHTH) protein
MDVMPRVRFDRFEFDPPTGELWMDGRRVRLQRQPSRLLELLVARPGGVVAREEIRQALWGDDTHVDFERSLNFCVGKLRSALGDNATAPRFVETVPTRGYRFIAPVEASFPLKAEATKLDVAPPTDVASAFSGLSGVEGTRKAADVESRRARIAAAIAGVLIAAVIALRIFGDGVSFGTPRVVVVPFHNETGSPDFDRVAKGVSDATVARLASSDRLRVIGNAAGLSFSFRPRDMKAMGESLGAQYLVLGQMKRDDRQVRIVAHLIRVSDQTHLWADTFDRPILDLDAQAAIADAIAKAVASRVRKG